MEQTHGSRLAMAIFIIIIKLVYDHGTSHYQVGTCTLEFFVVARLIIFLIEICLDLPVMGAGEIVLVVCICQGCFNVLEGRDLGGNSMYLVKAMFV